MDDVADISQQMSGILLRGLLLAGELRSEELKSWITSEIYGYKSGAELPDYRHMKISFLGHYNGRFGAQIRNVPLDTLGIPDDIRGKIEPAHLRDGIAALEQLVLTSSDTFNSAQPWVVVEIFRQFGPQFEGYTLNFVNAWYTKPAVVNLINTVRTRLLEFLLEIVDRYPDLKKDDAAAETIPASDVNQLAKEKIFHQFFLSTGAMQVGDIYSAGQAGAMGPGSHAHDMSFQQLWAASSSQIDLSSLASELRLRLPQLRSMATKPEHNIAIGYVEAAASSAQAGDGAKSFEYLKSAGVWVWETLTAIGTGVAIEAVKANLGL